MRIQYVCDKHITYTRRKRMNITQTKLGTKLSSVYKYNVIKVTVCPQLWTYPYITHRASWAGVSTTLDINPAHKHFTPVRLGCPPLWTKKPVYKHLTPVRLVCPLWTKKKRAWKEHSYRILSQIIMITELSNRLQ